MKVAVFDCHPFEQEPLSKANEPYHHEMVFLSPRLNGQTANMAQGFPAVASFANDSVDSTTLGILQRGGTRLIALRSAGFNHVDLEEAGRLGMRIVRVPAYSPYAIAEHAVALILTLNRKIHRAYARVRELNFALDGLVGFDIHGKTVGVVGAGKIGSVFSGIMRGFGCKILVYDSKPSLELEKEYGVTYTNLDNLYSQSDIISLHLPLNKSTRHMVDERAFKKMKQNVILINTGRGALIDTKALISALKEKRIGAAGLDVYEEEEEVFFRDLSGEILQDEVLARLLTFPNVLITSHQGFLTHEALSNIADTTLKSIDDFSKGLPLEHEIVWNSKN